MPPSIEEIAKSAEARRPRPADSYHHYFSYLIDKQLNQNNTLTDLEYSLESVNNFSEPIRHFQTQYRKLIEDDFETIVNGWIYATRTVFGKLVNSIPRQNKLEFMLQAIDRFDTIEFKSVPLLDGLDFLNEFIETRILSRGKLLVATNRLISKKLNDLFDKDEVGFIDPMTEKSNRIAPQAAIFEQLLALENDVNLKTNLNKAIHANEDLESRFEKQFSKKSWPIDLRV